MPRKTPPSFDFYPDDFIGGTYYVPWQAIGLYMRLLMYQWAEDGIPDDADKMAEIIQCSRADFDQFWPKIANKFTTDGNGVLYNERLKSEKAKKLAISGKRAKAGRKGGQAIAKQMPSVCLSKRQAKTKQREEGSRKREVGSRKREDGSEKPEVGAIIEHYKAYQPRSRPGAKERQKIAERLAEGFTVEDLKLAIDGNHKSPHHCGQNDTGTTYHNLELIVRDSAHVNQFINAAGSNGRAKPHESTRI
jgi:uncharacterized protein YdaU (DUF1376 family)